MLAQVVELVDTQDLKSCGHCVRIGSIPIPGTKFRASKESESEPYRSEFFSLLILTLSFSLFQNYFILQNSCHFVEQQRARPFWLIELQIAKYIS